MSDHRLSRTNGKDDDARLLLAAARERIAVAAADISLPDGLRLTEWQRTTISTILSKLVRTIEDELRTSLAGDALVQAHDALHAALSSAHVPIAGPILERSSVHADRPLVSALLRRAEEHRRYRPGAAGQSALLLELIRDQDPVIADHAMAILIGQSRRLDSFSDPVAARTELPAELEHRLVWRVAAALRHYMIEHQRLEAAAADAAVVAAAEQLLADYDEGDSLEARAMRLARRLAKAGRLDDVIGERALTDGVLPLLIAVLAVRAGISHTSAWEILSDPRGRGPVLLLKAAGFDRPHAAAIFLELGSSEEAVALQVDLFEVTELSTAETAIRLWQVNPGYREAIAEIEA